MSIASFHALSLIPVDSHRRSLACQSLRHQIRSPTNTFPCSLEYVALSVLLLTLIMEDMLMAYDSPKVDLFLWLKMQNR